VTKIQQIEQEIAQYQHESSTLRKIREEQEEELKRLRIDSEAMKAKMAEREREFELYREEESKRLKKERLVLGQQQRKAAHM
jgi:hypothetical protein